MGGGGGGWWWMVVVVPSLFHAPLSNTRYDRITPDHFLEVNPLCVCVCVCGKGSVSFWLCHATRNSSHSDNTFSSLTHHTLITYYHPHSHYIHTLNTHSHHHSHHTLSSHTLCVCVWGKGMVSFCLCHTTHNSPHSDHTYSSLTHHILSSTLALHTLNTHSHH